MAWVLVLPLHGVGFHVWVSVSKFWFGHVRCPRTALPRTFLPSLGVFSLNFGGVEAPGTNFLSVFCHNFLSVFSLLGVISEFWWSF